MVPMGKRNDKDKKGSMPDPKLSKRPVRDRKTPNAAAAERLRLRMQEAAEREREAMRRKQIAERRQEEILARPPASDADRSVLDNIAFNIHAAYNWDGRDTQATTAV